MTNIQQNPVQDKSFSIIIGEKWKSVKGFAGKYLVSNKGRVYSFHKRDIVSSKIKGGYPTIRLSINGKRKDIRIHIWEARVFTPNPENKPQVNHKDGIKHNNDSKNHEWATAKENIQHAVRTGLFMSQKRIDYLKSIEGEIPKQFENINLSYVGKDNGKSKPVILLDLNKKPIQEFESGNLCAKFIGTKQKSVARALKMGYRCKNYYFMYK